VVVLLRGPILRVLGALTVTVTLSTQVLYAQTGAPAEYRIKAVFLFNFIQFVEWPPSAFADDRAPLVICVFGRDPFGGALEETLKGEWAGKRRMVVRRSEVPEGLDTCHLLFVSKSEKARLGAVLRAVGSSAPVLTVSDIDGFVEGGGTIGFFFEGHRIRFEISPSQAQRHGLKLSSQLLGLGRIRESKFAGGTR
jgi:hypothetical protein